MLFRFPRPSHPTSNLVRHRSQRFRLSSLEARQLLSLGSEFAVNTTTRGAQYEADNASAPDGRHVIVYTDQVSTTNHDIRARLYNSDGTAAGPDFAVDSSTADD